MRDWLAIIIVLILACVLTPADVLACPACKETVRGQADGALSAGFNYTVFGLIGMVFGLVATVATVVARAYRRHASE